MVLLIGSNWSVQFVFPYIEHNAKKELTLIRVFFIVKINDAAGQVCYYCWVMPKAYDVANYFLSKVDEEAGDLVSNLKLQKLMYYAQGYHLALYDKPLFPDSIKAWAHGPVVPSVYRKFCDRKAGGLKVSQPFDSKSLTKEVRGLLDEVYKVYGQFSAWKLRNMTHDESPWTSTRQSNTITHEALKSFFKTRLA